jgi:hypothetical protein
MQVANETLAIKRNASTGIRRPRCFGGTRGNAFHGRKLRPQAIERFFGHRKFRLDADSLRRRRRRIQRSQSRSLDPFLHQHPLRRPNRHFVVDQPPAFSEQHQEPRNCESDQDLPRRKVVHGPESKQGVRSEPERDLETPDAGLAAGELLTLHRGNQGRRTQGSQQRRGLRAWLIAVAGGQSF